MPQYDLIVLDFDGTFTDVEREAVPFLAHYRRGLAELVGREIDALWERAVRTVRAEPDAHGFRYAERIVAPSHADPYILSSCASRLVLDELGVTPEGEGYETLFHRAYAHADTVFRPDARAVVDALLALDVPTFVVSNSRTDNVIRKLHTLGEDLVDRLEVRGDARKFHLVDPEPADPRFASLPERLEVEALSRPIFLRRGRYFEALSAIWSATGTTPDRTLVCGDIFELDLALPQALGASVHLVGREDTPDWERGAVSAGGGSFSTELTGVLDRL